MAAGKTLDGKPYAGNPHVRFDEGADAQSQSGHSTLLYKTTRREFAMKLAGSAGCVALGGCQALGLGNHPRDGYGRTIRDRLWMWGHHPLSLKTAKLPFGDKPHVDMAAACQGMGIPNVCCVRWTGLPKPPFDDYIVQFRGMKRVAWSVTDDADEPFEKKVDLAFALFPKMPNLTTLYLDDYFNIRQRLTRPISDLEMLRERLDALPQRGRLASVLYADGNGFRDKYRPSLALCDEVSLWFWSVDGLGGMEYKACKCREFLGSDKSLMLGIYMWDFGGNRDVPGDRIYYQLDTAHRLLSERVIDGLIFHCTPLCDTGLLAVEKCRDWIAKNADDEWGV